MTVEIRVGPPQLAIHQAYTVLITEPDGQYKWSGEKGLYFFDTRMISAYALYANGSDWDLLNSGAPDPFASRVFLASRVFPSEDGDVPARTLSLVLSRMIDGGMHERLEVTNHGRSRVRFTLEVSLRSDFADIFEVKSNRIIRRGRVTTTWDDAREELVTSYRNGGFSRTLSIRAEAPTHAYYANGRLNFPLVLGAGQTWAGALLYGMWDGETEYPAPSSCEVGTDCRQRQILRDWRERCLSVETSNAGFLQLYEQAIEDMAALRLPIEKGAAMEYIPAAGLPWFVALFGRDTLITSMQTITLNSDCARGTLDILAHWQATENDPYRDAEPGKILHELRRGELAALKLIPHTPYYGTADATPLFLMCLSALWRATADRAAVEANLAAAAACLDWIDHYGDRDGDGFQEYGTRSAQGYENVGWKDSGEAVVDVDGTMVRGPKALCELQGYVYAAWRGMAEVYRDFGDGARAEALEAKAERLYERFNAVFWDEAGGFYAYCLDGDKRPIWTVSSNVGHLLWTGIVPPERAARVVARLFEPDMSSGWGIRTLTMSNPTYNPISYQNGSVWPHDNSLIALGCKRYGFAEAALGIATAIAQAAGYFSHRQLPELYAGMQRGEASFPVQYLGANVPQAWAAGAVFALLQAMLGIELDAPRGVLHVDPSLPAWLPDITLRGLRMGSASFDLAFHRVGGRTEMQVLRGDPSVVRRAELARVAA